jgi:DNA-binding FrmR family transcriptional regulator
MKADKRAKIENRLSRIAGQVTGLQKMVVEDRYCVDILTQVAAIRSAIDALGVELLTNHVETCVAGHAGERAHGCAQAQTMDEVLGELRLSLSRFLK